PRRQLSALRRQLVDPGRLAPGLLRLRRAAIHQPQLPLPRRRHHLGQCEDRAGPGRRPLVRRTRTVADRPRLNRRPAVPGVRPLRTPREEGWLTRVRSSPRVAHGDRTVRFWHAVSRGGVRTRVPTVAGVVALLRPRRLFTTLGLRLGQL